MEDYSDSSDDEFLVVAIGTAHFLKKVVRSKRRTPRFNINPYLKDRPMKGRFVRDDMVSYAPTFKENFHMDKSQFDFVHNVIKHRLGPKKHSRPDSISSEEKLSMTLDVRLVAASHCKYIQSWETNIREHTTRYCLAIFEEFSKMSKEMAVSDWIDAANQNQYVKWNLPNVLGAVDGKHCAIQCPENAGSAFYNHKGFHSIVLMGVADANYKFIYFDAGAFGSEGDSTIFAETSFGRKLYGNKLNLPPAAPIQGKLQPYYFIGDDAFPLSTRMMKPFCPRDKTKLSNEERIFNYRLSRARRCVENAFGILCARWKCLSRTMFMKPDRAQIVVAASCSLHNYLMSGETYCPPGFADVVDLNGQIVLGGWRRSLPDQSLFYNGQTHASAGRIQQSAKEMREFLKDYVNSVEGSVPWEVDC